MAKNNRLPQNILQNRHVRELPVKLVMTVILSVIAVMMVVPFVWMLSASFKYEREVMKIPIQWIPKNPTLDNYKEILHTIRSLDTSLRSRGQSRPVLELNKVLQSSRKEQL
jgi:multiple sugar transport system permease protein